VRLNFREVRLTRIIVAKAITTMQFEEKGPDQEAAGDSIMLLAIQQHDSRNMESAKNGDKKGKGKK